MIETISEYCPYCGEPIELVLDLSVSHQEYIEDCQVCCRPMQVSLAVSGSGEPEVLVRREDD